MYVLQNVPLDLIVAIQHNILCFTYVRVATTLLVAGYSDLVATWINYLLVLKPPIQTANRTFQLTHISLDDRAVELSE